MLNQVVSGKTSSQFKHSQVPLFNFAANVIFFVQS